MRVIRTWEDLPPFGIVPVSTFHCALEFRWLCDVTAKAKKNPGAGLQCQ